MNSCNAKTNERAEVKMKKGVVAAFCVCMGAAFAAPVSAFSSNSITLDATARFTAEFLSANTIANMSTTPSGMVIIVR